MPVVRIGTSEKDGTFWTEGEAIAGLLLRDHGISTEIMEAGKASIENARGLDEDRIDFGFMASNWIGRAYHGETPFAREIDISMIAPVNCGAMFFITKKDSGLRTVRDMVGKRVCIGPKGSGMVQHIHTIFGVLGIGFDEFTPVHMSFEDGGRALETGDVDAQWQCPYPNAVMRAISKRIDVRVLSYEPDDLAAVLGNVEFYRRANMPVGLFRGVEVETEQVAVVNIVASHARFDREVVHSFVSTILFNLEELSIINPLFGGLDIIFEGLRSEGSKSLEFGGVPLHPGALQAYRDAGYLS
ncbi:MAG: TAXI family TRAP transporter solute-binding subunit [Pseudomonadota bacterium]|nr:TAXI family TRAP transporter solute-binding subunit [Pseudomonadota bacterium]